VKCSSTGTNRVPWYGCAYFRKTAAEKERVAGPANVDGADCRRQRRFALWPASLYKEDAMVINSTDGRTPRVREGVMDGIGGDRNVSSPELGLMLGMM